jgi:hypothetical protein
MSQLSSRDVGVNHRFFAGAPDARALCGDRLTPGSCPAGVLCHGERSSGTISVSRPIGNCYTFGGRAFTAECLYPERTNRELTRPGEQQPRRRYGPSPLTVLSLPSGAQFGCNRVRVQPDVIESVFSRMARAILHNNNYKNVDECKAAINMCFADRNRAFLKRPRRSGKTRYGVRSRSKRSLGRKSTA